MALYDCFMFFNELDILEIRLNELNSVVDYFVLAEATVTFTGKPKPLHYSDNKERFKEFEHKIIHVVVDDMPTEVYAAQRERFQRDALDRGLSDARPDDIIMLSDADEIPYPDTLLRFAGTTTNYKIIFLECIPYSYKLNLEVEKESTIQACRLIQKKHLTIPMDDLHCTRARQSRRYPNWLNTSITTVRNKFKFGSYLRCIRVPRAGWHFSFMGSPELIQYKIASYSHQERNTPEFTSLENIRLMIREKRNITGHSIKKVPKDVLPRYVLDNETCFSHLIDD